jgi:hypothetical protein
MRVGDGDLVDLRRRNDTEVRTWLWQHQPAVGDDRAYWWENLMTLALQGMYLAESDSNRRDYAGLAYVATGEAISQSVMSERDGVIRMANLAAFYLSAGRVDDPPFDVDSIVARCLDLLDVPLDVAMEQVKNWKVLPVEQLRVLRAAKNMLMPCERISDRVTSPDLIDRLSGWLTILAALP